MVLILVKCAKLRHFFQLSENVVGLVHPSHNKRKLNATCEVLIYSTYYYFICL